jgi:hypothetical protein
VRRLLLNLLRALSLLVCVAVVVVVTHTYWTGHSFERHRDGVAGNTWWAKRWNVEVARGVAHVERSSGLMTFESPDGPPAVAGRVGAAAKVGRNGRWPARSWRGRQDTVWQRLGFDWVRYASRYGDGELRAWRNSGPGGERGLTSLTVDRLGFALPLWLVALCCLLPPAFWCVRVARHVTARRKARLGLCPACGYDLRATPERCPECGAGVAESC